MDFMKTVQFYFLLFCSVILVLFQPACGILDSSAKETEIAANIFATQTAQAPTDTPTPTITPTPTPTPTETPVPTATPTPTPAFSAVTLTLEDLPPGFEELPQDQVFLYFSELEDMDIQSRFGFVDADGFSLLMGFRTYIPEQQDQLDFDLLSRLFGELFGDILPAEVGFEGDFDLVEILHATCTDGDDALRAVLANTLQACIGRRDKGFFVLREL